jgi:hypothetical protein
VHCYLPFFSERSCGAKRSSPLAFIPGCDPTHTPTADRIPAAVVHDPQDFGAKLDAC